MYHIYKLYIFMYVLKQGRQQDANCPVFECGGQENFLLSAQFCLPPVCCVVMSVMHVLGVACIICKKQHVICNRDQRAFTRLVAVLGARLLQGWGSHAPRRGPEQGRLPERGGGRWREEGGGFAGNPPGASERKPAWTEQSGPVSGRLSRKPEPGRRV